MTKPTLKRLQKGAPASQAPQAQPSNPLSAPPSAPGHLQSPASPGPALDAAQGWTEEQKAALQRAFLTVKPNQAKFWLHVAKLVPGKTALQCCNAKFDEMPTPVEKPKPRGKGQGGSPLQAPALKLAAGIACTYCVSLLVRLTLFRFICNTSHQLVGAQCGLTLRVKMVKLAWMQHGLNETCVTTDTNDHMFTC